MSKIVPVVLSNLEPTAQRDDDASSVSSDLNFDSENSKQKDHSEVTYGDLGSNAHSRFRHELKAKIIQEVMDEVLPDIGAYDIDGSVEKEQVRKGRCIDCLKFLDLWPLTIHETILNGDWKKFEKFAKDITTDKPPPKYKTCFYRNKFNPLLVNQYDEQGRSPLGLAVKINSFEMVDILITNKAFPDICDEGTGRTPLMYSIINKSLPISKLLIQAGASVNMCDFRWLVNHFGLFFRGLKNDFNLFSSLALPLLCWLQAWVISIMSTYWRTNWPKSTHR